MYQLKRLSKNHRKIFVFRCLLPTRRIASGSAPPLYDSPGGPQQQHPKMFEASMYRRARDGGFGMAVTRHGQIGQLSACYSTDFTYLPGGTFFGRTRCSLEKGSCSLVVFLIVRSFLVCLPHHSLSCCEAPSSGQGAQIQRKFAPNQKSSVETRRVPSLQGPVLILLLLGLRRVFMSSCAALLSH
mmetsp:Transcript_4932/g.10611  ORF Transcript_4932/g.10611 Transcript_4932/m.10611 type:complete len:185 (+) Transcript_4932:69-623(+)